MMVEQFSKENKQHISERLKKAIDAEYTASSCFKYISQLVKNGRIRSQFSAFAEESERNKKLLLEYLANFSEENFILEEKCYLCKLTPESFSLLGALSLGLEIMAICTELYSGLFKLYKPSEDKELFKRLLKEKDNHRYFLKKEKRFVENKPGPDFIRDFCIPNVVGKLLK